MYNVKIKIFAETGEAQYEFYENPVIKGKKKLPWKMKEPEEKEKNIIANYRRSMRRTEQQIYDIARANKFDWFITLTVDPSQADRSNISEVMKKLKNQIDYRLRRNNKGLQYVIVPELHEDGQSVHFHGLFKGIQEKQLKKAVNPKTGNSVMTNGKQGIKQVYNWTKYTLGFSTAIKITQGTSARMANYMLNQYLTEGLFVRSKGKKRYLLSEGLKRPDIKEYIMTAEEQKKLKSMIKEKTVSEKTVKVDTIDYKNVIDYIQVIATPDNIILPHQMDMNQVSRKNIHEVKAMK